MFSQKKLGSLFHSIPSVISGFLVRTVIRTRLTTHLIGTIDFKLEIEKPVRLRTVIVRHTAWAIPLVIACLVENLLIIRFCMSFQELRI